MIPVFKPNLRTNEILKSLEPVLDSGWVGLGSAVKKFEKSLCSYLGCEEFVATNSCTAALHLSLKVLDLPKGSRVLTTPITFASPNLMILQEGYIPVFCDVDPMTGCIDVESIKSILKVNPDIAALILVHIGGYPCDLDEIQEICDNVGIPIIEDCAHALGSVYKGKKIGNSKNLCCFSFHAVKNMTTGDGGGIATSDPEKASRLRKLAWYGCTKDTYARIKPTYSWRYDIEEVGNKYHMNDITATIGNTQLKYIDQDNNNRRKVAEFYLNHLNKKVIKPSYKKDRESNYHFIPLHFEDRDKMAEHLQINEVSSSVHYLRNDKLTVLQDFYRDLSGVESYSNTQLTLPIYPTMTAVELEKVVEVVNAF